MKLTGHTILITGGASGIGRGLAEAFHARGNQVIIAGRRRTHLDAVTKANPGMRAFEMDVADPANISHVTKRILAEHPALDVLINNAGVMQADNAASAIEDDLVVDTITTNLMGPIRVTANLVEHLKKQESAAIVNVSSFLGFVPLVFTAVYCSTKAALHSYSQSLRYRLRGTSVEVLEMIPPWVRTELMNSSEAEQAMPLAEFIAETMNAFESGGDEILVERARALRNNVGPNEGAFVNQFNDLMAAAGFGR